MRTALLLTFVLVGLCGRAQERCGSVEYRTAHATDAEAQRMAEAETFLQKNTFRSFNEGGRGTNASVVRIPVVVHILYNNSTAFVSDEQVQSQVDALNRDFRRRNEDTLNTPARFRSLAADVQVEFYLAASDPAGRPTNGIVRKFSSINTWLLNDRIKFSSKNGDDAWDSRSYLNIWVGNLVAGVGYSSAPGGDPARDGIVVATAAFGTIGKSGNYNKGRTATHEVGHWLGLRHIWGDADCGDDGIADTPQQGAYTVNCPTGFRSTCNNTETGDMYMNYMDYTADACTNLFTLGQKTRMRACFAAGGPREAMLTSRGLAAPLAETIAAAETGAGVSLYPNPASTEVNLQLPAASLGKRLLVYNANGALVHTVTVQAALQKIGLSSFKAGVYFVRGEGVSARFVKL